MTRKSDGGMSQHIPSGSRIPTGWRDTGYHAGTREYAQGLAAAMAKESGVPHKVIKLGYRTYAVLRYAFSPKSPEYKRMQA
jgi:hypothetical protein